MQKLTLATKSAFSLLEKVTNWNVPKVALCASGALSFEVKTTSGSFSLPTGRLASRLVGSW